MNSVGLYSSQPWRVIKTSNVASLLSITLETIKLYKIYVLKVSSQH